MNRLNSLLILLLLIVGQVLIAQSFKKEVVVKNLLPFSRHEVVSIPTAKLKNIGEGNVLLVTEKKSRAIMLCQRIDNNGDGVSDEFIFEVNLAANEQKELVIEVKDEKTNIEVDTRTTYSRLVPERIDDYAWENDLVAFRTYGPEAQRLVDENKEGGTLSSGLDCWLKRVNYSVIDKWYKKYVDGGSYHKDDGEGYDPYHVGASRGCGGIGVWKNDSLYVSKNFTSNKKIAEGPLRNIFELTYAPWIADGIKVNETKRITIDLGNQLYKVDDVLTTSGNLNNVTIGVTLHDQKGTVNKDLTKGWFAYWEPIDDSEIGTGVVIDPKTLLKFEDYRTKKKDLSQLHIIVQPKSTVTYYTGFGWKKAGVIKSSEEWNDYLGHFSERLASPLQVIVK